MITATENAISEIKNIRIREKKPEAHLRVGVVGGGCSGMSYKLDFTNETTDKDKIFEIAPDLKIVVDKKSFLYIDGMTLDFSGGLNGTGFGFINPNAKRTCGCGSSFSV